MVSRKPRSTFGLEDWQMVSDLLLVTSTAVHEGTNFRYDVQTADIYNGANIAVPSTFDAQGAE